MAALVRSHLAARRGTGLRAFSAHVWAREAGGVETYASSDEGVAWRRLWPKRGEVVEVEAGDGGSWRRARVGRRLFASSEFDAQMLPADGDGEEGAAAAAELDGRYRLKEEGVEWRRPPPSTASEGE